jgi:hypothetical protein
VWDSREVPPHADTLRANCRRCGCSAASCPETLPDGVKLVLKSPGLAPHDPRIAPLLDAARAAGIADGRAGPLHAGLADLKAQTAPHRPNRPRPKPLAAAGAAAASEQAANDSPDELEPVR